MGELRSRVPLRLHLQVVETTVVLPVVSKRVGVYENGEDTVTGVGRERLRLRRERDEDAMECGGSIVVYIVLVGVFSKIADTREAREVSDVKIRHI